MTTEERQGPLVELGPAVKLPGIPFLLRTVNGEPFVLNPIRVNEAVSFLYDPTQPRKRSRKKDRDTQLTAFDDVPTVLYPMVRDESSTDEDLVIRGEDFSKVAKKYRDQIQSMGGETETSNTPYVISVDHLMKDFKIEGVHATSNFPLSGRFGEIRQNEGRTSIIKTKQTRGRPGTWDAIQLGIQYLAYQAKSGERDGVANPRLLVFSLDDGKTYQLNIFSDSFFTEVLTAVILSDLAENAGYQEADPSKSIVPGFDNEQSKVQKKVEIVRRGRREKLSPEEVFQKARNCLERLIGRSPHSSPHFAFVELP